MNETKKNAFANELTDEELDHVSGGVGKIPATDVFVWIKCPRCGHDNRVRVLDLSPRCEVPHCKKELR